MRIYLAQARLKKIAAETTHKTALKPSQTLGHFRQKTHLQTLRTAIFLYELKES